MKAFSSIESKEDNKNHSVSIEIHGNSVTLADPSSKKYVGLADPAIAPTFRQLLQKFSVTLVATLLHKTDTEKNKTRANCESGNRQLCIIMYGRRQDSELVGDALAESGLHLQHPHEYDTSVDYINPQYLLRPGSRIVIQHSASLATNLKSMVAKDALGEGAKSQILKVFDDATGPQVFPEIKTSPRILTSLKG